MVSTPISESEPLAVTALLRREAQVEIKDLLIDNPATKYRKTQIADEIGRSTGTVSECLGTGPHPQGLVSMGVADPIGIDESMPRYTLADTPVVDFFQQYNSYFPLSDFVGNSAKRKLTRFWLLRADRNENYTQYAITNEKFTITNTDYISNRAFNNNIDQYVDCGMVNKTEYKQRTEYTLDLPNNVYKAIRALEGIIWETVEHRDDEFLPDSVVDQSQ